ncbi:hypothetical protein EYF80_038925 [Liparis tanakae]|uniref:Uncharacterized protein n=1 Tax=Liparis tanakae TaxID=230148 RepID=A0A4Z2GDU0_9TELE|nr:hypothetical protein EYF80_038925 [Liparis tanakae]
MSSNSWSPRRYEELKHSEQMTLVTARVSSGDRSRARPAAAASDSTEHRERASEETEGDTGSRGVTRGHKGSRGVTRGHEGSPQGHYRATALP